MNDMQNEFVLPVLAIAAAACITDVTSRRIPNVLTFGAAAAALLVRGLLFGTSGIFDAAPAGSRDSSFCFRCSSSAAWVQAT